MQVLLAVEASYGACVSSLGCLKESFITIMIPLQSVGGKKLFCEN